MKNLSLDTKLKNTCKLFTLAILTIVSFNLINAQTPVEWTDVVNATVDGNSLTKTTNTNWDGGAASTAVLPAGQDGYVEIDAAQTNNGVMFGFSETNTDATWGTIDYNFYAHEGGIIRIYEGTNKVLDNGGAYSVGDKFRVERIGTTVYFKHNGNTIYTSTTPSTTSLIVDCSMYKLNAVLANAVISFGEVGTAVDDDWADAGTGAMQTANTTDKVGIGRTPSYKLDVNGDVRGNWFRTLGARGLYGQSYGIYFQALSANYWRMRSNRGMEVRTKTNKRMGVLYHNADNAFGLLDGDANWAMRIEKDSYTSFAINNSEKMRINNTGQIIVGATTAPSMITALSEPYLFYVNGGILAKEVKVEAGWADYVFEADYNLTSLENVEEHINNYGYLHNTPSEEELAENGGFELGTMTVNQQEKIEEIFLHLIALDKEVKTLKKENQSLKAQIKEQK